MVFDAYKAHKAQLSAEKKAFATYRESINKQFDKGAGVQTCVSEPLSPDQYETIRTDTTKFLGVVSDNPAFKSKPLHQRKSLLQQAGQRLQQRAPLAATTTIITALEEMQRKEDAIDQVKATLHSPTNPISAAEVTEVIHSRGGSYAGSEPRSAQPSPRAQVAHSPAIVAVPAHG